MKFDFLKAKYIFVKIRTQKTIYILSFISITIIVENKELIQIAHKITILKMQLLSDDFKSYCNIITRKELIHYLITLV